MHPRRALALTLVVPLLLGGCSEDPEPTPKMPDPTTSSATPTATASETPETPEEETAEDFIRRWQAAGDQMQVTGETSAYLGLSPRCTACKSLAENVDEIYRGGGRVEFDGTKIVSLKRVGARPPTYDVGLELPKTVIYRGADDQPESLPSGGMTIRVTLEEGQDGWTVSRYGVL